MKDKKLRKMETKIYNDLNDDFEILSSHEERALVLDLVKEFNDLNYFARNLLGDAHIALGNMMHTVRDFLDGGESKTNHKSPVDRSDWMLVNAAIEKLSKLI